MSTPCQSINLSYRFINENKISEPGPIHDITQGDIEYKEGAIGFPKDGLIVEDRALVIYPFSVYT